ncbi:MAG: C39 family peptidase [Patescibacteria group bacterium]
MKNKIIFIPENILGAYEWQDRNYRIDRVKNIKDFHAKKAEFFNTAIGKTFLGYKVKRFINLNGIDVWFVDGDRLRSGVKGGDIDFTMGGHAYRYLYIPEGEIWIEGVYQRTKELMSIVWHEYLEQLLMCSGMSYSKAHYFASIFEMTLKEGKYIMLPIGTYRQKTKFTCGPAALKIVSEYLGLSASEKYIAKLSKTTKTKGTNPQDLVEGAKNLGFSAYQKEHLTLNEVKNLIKKGIPIIANYQYEPQFGEGHYAVIIGFSKDNFILSDPGITEGYQVAPIKEFMKNWFELEDKTHRQGVIISGNKKL